MKILFVSMPSIHAIRWINNLKDSNHSLFWFDILSKGELNSISIPEQNQYTNWEKRKMKYIKGEFSLYKNFPSLYSRLESYFKVTVTEYFEEIILSLKPDLVHSFEMQSCSYPLTQIMKKYPKIKWLYSCWGSDLFYYYKFNHHFRKINAVLKRTDFLLSDCKRDVVLAKKTGFKGTSFGVLPGGSGYNIKEYLKHRTEIGDRKIILVKGYEHNFGRAVNIIKALLILGDKIKDLKIVVYGAHKKVIDFINKNNLNITYYGRHELSHSDLLKLMGISKIHIGNSISDGIPNTLLESIIMGSFPIQSNPGGATEEYITDNANGFLINDPNDIQNIAQLILSALKSKDLVETASNKNLKIAKNRLDQKKIEKQILKIYDKISDEFI
jgi:glycosyltransferase involved in cell wall biosynthesis